MLITLPCFSAIERTSPIARDFLQRPINIRLARVDVKCFPRYGESCLMQDEHAKKISARADEHKMTSIAHCVRRIGSVPVIVKT